MSQRAPAHAPGPFALDSRARQGPSRQTILQLHFHLTDIRQTILQLHFHLTENPSSDPAIALSFDGHPSNDPAIALSFDGDPSNEFAIALSFEGWIVRQTKCEIQKKCRSLVKPNPKCRKSVGSHVELLMNLQLHFHLKLGMQKSASRC